MPVKVDLPPPWNDPAFYQHGRRDCRGAEHGPSLWDMARAHWLLTWVESQKQVETAEDRIHAELGAREVLRSLDRAVRSIPLTIDPDDYPLF